MRFTFFWRKDSPFSQWHPSPFTLAGEQFSCAEQYMMWAKAKLFGDVQTARKILDAATPREHKDLGRRVTPFDEGRWVRERERIVHEASVAKFLQNPELLDALLATQGTELVEASPTDRVWGIGLSADDPLAQDPSRWPGLNLLGKTLIRVRDELLKSMGRSKA